MSGSVMAAYSNGSVDQMSGEPTLQHQGLKLIGRGCWLALMKVFHDEVKPTSQRLYISLRLPTRKTKITNRSSSMLAMILMSPNRYFQKSPSTEPFRA
jgi:hypothetical protein